MEGWEEAHVSILTMTPYTLPVIPRLCNTLHVTTSDVPPISQVYTRVCTLTVKGKITSVEHGGDGRRVVDGLSR